MPSPIDPLSHGSSSTASPPPASRASNVSPPPVQPVATAPAPDSAVDHRRTRSTLTVPFKGPLIPRLSYAQFSAMSKEEIWNHMREVHAQGVTICESIAMQSAQLKAANSLHTRLKQEITATKMEIEMIDRRRRNLGAEGEALQAAQTRKRRNKEKRRSRRTATTAAPVLAPSSFTRAQPQ